MHGKRQQERAKEREMSKLRSRLFTYPETQELVQTAIKDTQKKYDLQYSMCLATALNTEPTKFGKRRVCRTLKLFFDQIEGLRTGIITEDQIREEAAKLGVIIVNDSSKLEIYLNPKLKEIDCGGENRVVE